MTMSGEATITTEADRQDTYGALSRRIHRLQVERRRLLQQMEEVERDLLAAMEELNCYQLEPGQSFQVGCKVTILNKPYQDQCAEITGYREDTHLLGENKVWNIVIRGNRSTIKTHRKQRFLRVVPPVGPAPSGPSSSSSIH